MSQARGKPPVQARGADTRRRVVTATSELFRHQGFAATGMKQIAEASAAPFGSVYHFFPGGKEELGAEVIRVSGQVYLDLIALFFDAADTAEAGTRDFFDGAAAVLRETDYTDACPIATVALEVASTSETMRAATAEVFESWIEDLTRRMQTAGVGAKRARELAVVGFSLIEGAFILSRATRDATHVETAGAAMVELVRAELERVAESGPRVKQ